MELSQKNAFHLVQGKAILKNVQHLAKMDQNSKDIMLKMLILLKDIILRVLFMILF